MLQSCSVACCLGTHRVQWKLIEMFHYRVFRKCHRVLCVHECGPLQIQYCSRLHNIRTQN